MNITNITRSKKYKHKVLIVDDGNISLKVYEAIVMTLPNTTVRSLGNPVDATALVKKEPLSLIITDYHMDEMSGLDFIKEVKKTSLNNHVPILVVTVENDKSIHRALIEHGADRVVLKSANLNSIIDIVSSLLETGKQKLAI